MQRIKNIFKVILGKTYFSLLAPQALKKIIASREKADSPEKSYQWTEEFLVGPKLRGFNINFRPSQIKSEIIGLATELQKNPPRRLLEIGTATGSTLFIFARVAAEDAKIISLDLPFGRYGAGYLSYRLPLLRAFASQKQSIHLLRTDSHKPKAHQKIANLLNGELLDFLFIDGDHSYNGVKADFDNYHHFVRPGGIIAFHDIVDNRLDSSFGTQKFWQEIKDNYEHQEFIRPNADQTGCGIGLIRLAI